MLRLLRNYNPRWAKDVFESQMHADLIFHCEGGAMVATFSALLSRQSDLIAKLVQEGRCQCEATACPAKVEDLHLSLPGVTKGQLDLALTLLIQGIGFAQADTARETKKVLGRLGIAGCEVEPLTFDTNSIFNFLNDLEDDDDYDEGMVSEQELDLDHDLQDDEREPVDPFPDEDHEAEDHEVDPDHPQARQESGGPVIKHLFHLKTDAKKQWVEKSNNGDLTGFVQTSVKPEIKLVPSLSVDVNANDEISEGPLVIDEKDEDKSSSGENIPDPTNLNDLPDEEAEERAREAILLNRKKKIFKPLRKVMPKLKARDGLSSRGWKTCERCQREVKDLRGHLARIHFQGTLHKMLKSDGSCPQCDYRGTHSKVVTHLAKAHRRIDQKLKPSEMALLGIDTLPKKGHGETVSKPAVKRPASKTEDKPAKMKRPSSVKKIKCPHNGCQSTTLFNRCHLREHFAVSHHLNEIQLVIERERHCPYCPFGNKPHRAVVRHLGTTHGMVDGMLDKDEQDALATFM